MLLFIFINSFAFLLLGLAVFIGYIPINVLLVILKYSCSLLCVIAAVNIFSQWKRKKRMIEILLKRNKDEFKIESFTNYMETFCSQLVVIYVLKKLKRLDALKGLYLSWWRDFL